MKIVDLYSKMRSGLDAPEHERYRAYEIFEREADLNALLPLAKSWQMDWKSTEAYLRSKIAIEKRATAESYLKVAAQTVGEVETALGRELPGVLVLMPSFGDFDGFARYESGSHTVLFGVDFPDADVDYLRALTAHELSHVYRDHSPKVWAHLGKPLKKISRAEYLDAATAQEHLVSEGLATLFSMTLFPEIEARIHHYYESDEWEWCLAHDEAIDRAFRDELAGDQDVWSFYSPNRVKRGSPSRTQYYWAAKVLSQRLEGLPREQALKALIDLHGVPASEFTEFQPS